LSLPLISSIHANTHILLPGVGEIVCEDDLRGGGVAEGAGWVDHFLMGRVDQNYMSENNSREVSYNLPGEIFTTGICL